MNKKASSKKEYEYNHEKDFQTTFPVLRTT